MFVTQHPHFFSSKPSKHISSALHIIKKPPLPAVCACAHVCGCAWVCVCVRVWVNMCVRYAAVQFCVCSMSTCIIYLCSGHCLFIETAVYEFLVVIWPKTFLFCPLCVFMHFSASFCMAHCALDLARDHVPWKWPLLLSLSFIRCSSLYSDLTSGSQQ